MKPCLRCLLSEMPDQARLAESLRELIELIPEEDRTPEPLRIRRLEACRRCSFLNAGTCALCGCYVEHRASRRGAGCPDVPDRWAFREAGARVPGEGDSRRKDI